MALTIPRISITVDDEHDEDERGELSTLSLGFGLREAWIFAAMFGTTSIYGAPYAQPIGASTLSFVFFISIVAFGATLLFCAITDQKFLKFYTSKQVLAAAALLTSVGTFAVFASGMPGPLGDVATWFSGIATGIGSASLLLYWGIAFSRESAATIVVNTAVGIVIAVAIYSMAIHLLPPLASGVLTACLPLFELPLLWKLTPVSYAIRHVIPIFNPLPVKKGPFIVRFGLPALIFGFALGAMRSVSVQVILPLSDLATMLLILFVGGAITILLLITAFSANKRSHWDSLFRPIVPIIAVTLFFLPWLNSPESLVASVVLLVGYMCFEALMWIFFGELSQEFRPSPIFVYGVGRGCLAFGSIAGSYAASKPGLVGALTGFGDAGDVVVTMFALVVAYALLPRVRDIKRIIAPKPVTTGNAIASFNDEAESAMGVTAAPAPSPSTPAPAAGWRAAGSIQAASEDAGAQNQESEGDQSRRSGRFRGQCETIADRYLLSRRETEVMFLLAKGYNAAYITEKLCISKSTAKTHISHIYRKLDIHNQQELLAMVEEAREEASA